MVQCQLCNKYFKSIKGLNLNLLELHSILEPLICKRKNK